MQDSNNVSDNFVQRLGSSSDIEGIMSDGGFQQVYMDQEEGDNEPDDIIIVHMDIREPLRRLQKIVERKIDVDLKGYKFWLQDAQELEPHKNLVDQCVKGEGLVQINVQIQTTNQKINIVDVLKPTEAALAALAVEDDESKINTDVNHRKLQADLSNQNKFGDIEDIKPCLNWVLDSKFKKEQMRLQIPDDPNDWTIPQVNHWLEWAIKQFELLDINIGEWTITGNELCQLTHEEFRKKLPRDPGNVFWTHLQLLKECKFVSIVHKAAEEMRKPKEQKIIRKSFQTVRNISQSPQSPTNHNSTGPGNNSQVQLWQFLLEVLTDREHIDIIQWVGTDGEFKLIDPDRVARLWGEKKNKPAMNYEKLSRALRYYYDGDMISKVSGKRFAYKFDCDLKLLIGYDAAELSSLVNERTFAQESLFLLADNERQVDFVVKGESSS